MKFGDLIRQARNAKGWTQPEAAQKIGIEQSYLSKLENGHNYPAEDVFDRMAHIYGLDAKHLARNLEAEELTKLRDVSAIRSTLLDREQRQTLRLRAWVVSGLTMVMAAGGIATYDLTKPATITKEYVYKSDGILRDDEPWNLFQKFHDQAKAHSILKLVKLTAEPKPGSCPGTTSSIRKLREEFEASKADIKSRAIKTTLTFSASQNEPLFLQVEGGRRYYRPDAVNIQTLDQRNVPFLALATALFVGGLVCLYISRHWR